MPRTVSWNWFETFCVSRNWSTKLCVSRNWFAMFSVSWSWSTICRDSRNGSKFGWRLLKDMNVSFNAFNAGGLSASANALSAGGLNASSNALSADGLRGFIRTPKLFSSFCFAFRASFKNLTRYNRHLRCKRRIFESLSLPTTLTMAPLGKRALPATRISATSLRRLSSLIVGRPLLPIAFSSQQSG